jgi:hypothetical protein
VSTTGQVAGGRGRFTRYRDEVPSARSVQYFVRTRDAFGNYSVGAATVTVTDTAPAAPTIASITRFKNSLKIKVTPPAGSDLTALVLHASQTNGFTPSTATLVSGQVWPEGGEFVFQVPTTGTWYFKTAAADFLTERFADWVYSTQSSSSIIVVNAVDPTAVALSMPGSGDVGIGIDPLDGKSYQAKQQRKAHVTWSHTDDPNNPAGSLIGFQVVVYDGSHSAANPNFTSAVLADPSLRIYDDDGAHFPDNTTYTAAVKAVYVDGLTSNYVTSSGLTIPLDSNPNIRSSDDRNVLGYGDSFDVAALPVGFYVFQATTGFLDGNVVLTPTSSIRRSSRGTSTNGPTSRPADSWTRSGAASRRVWLRAHRVRHAAAGEFVRRR